MEPPRKIPPDLRDAFTLNGEIPVYDWYLNNVVPDEYIHWPNSFIQYFIDLFSLDALQTKEFTNETYPGSIKLHYKAFEKYVENIKDKKVAVIGSLTPWIEAILINFGAKEVTTVEYNVPFCNHPILKSISYTEFCETSQVYDSIVSYSSIEHSGLGRYGEPLNPNGDIETMEAINNALIPGGLCFVGFPVGKDYLVWNACRIYGEKRLPLLYGNKFKELEWFGCTKDYIHTCPDPTGLPDFNTQPIIVLQKAPLGMF